MLACYALYSVTPLIGFGDAQEQAHLLVFVWRLLCLSLPHTPLV